MANLEFGRSLDVNKWKEENGVSRIDVVKSPKTGNLFFTADGEVKGAASEGALTAETVSITEVQGDDGPFLLLHKRGNDNVVASF